jgi:hypothetical protein
MTTPPPQEEDAGSLLPALLTAYTGYLAWRAANGPLPGAWREVVDKLGLSIQLGDQLALLAARALARQRSEYKAAADELWTALPQGVQAGVDAGLQTVAEALIWTDHHESLDTKDVEEGIIPTLENPPEELALIVAQAVSGASQTATAEAAGWKWKTWMTAGDAEVRPTHQALKGEKIPLTAAFHTEDGDTLRYPGDPLASIGNRIGCRCTLHISR